MSDEEKSYEVKDKRKVKLDENGEVQVNPDAGAEQSAESGEAEAPEMGGLPDVDVYTMLRSFVSLLSMHVWHWMGLMKNPATGQMDKDLEQAKVAIDTIAAMAAQLEAKDTDAQKRELQGLLNDLRINYVQQSMKGKD